MEILNSQIEGYLKSLALSEDPVLEVLERRAEQIGFPIVGPLVGRVLQQLTEISGGRRILELGSGFGYSACWFARALDANGVVILTDFSEKRLEEAESRLDAGGFACRFEYHTGNALETLDRLNGPFDIIFNDVDKRYYPEVYQRAGARLQAGGLLISDNVLWHGRVVEQQPDEDTRGVLEYNRLIFNSPDFLSSVIPLRDGISVSLRR